MVKKKLSHKQIKLTTTRNKETKQIDTKKLIEMAKRDPTLYTIKSGKKND